MFQKYQKFKQAKKKKFKLIQLIKESFSLKDNDKILNSNFCQAQGFPDPNYNLCRAHIKISYFLNGKINNASIIKNQGFIILSNKTMLKQLRVSSQWFIDVTLKVVQKVFNKY